MVSSSLTSESRHLIFHKTSVMAMFNSWIIRAESSRKYTLTLYDSMFKLSGLCAYFQVNFISAFHFIPFGHFFCFHFFILSSPPHFGESQRATWCCLCLESLQQNLTCSAPFPTSWPWFSWNVMSIPIDFYFCPELNHNKWLNWDVLKLPFCSFFVCGSFPNWLGWIKH